MQGYMFYRLRDAWVYAVLAGVKEHAVWRWTTPRLHRYIEKRRYMRVKFQTLWANVRERLVAMAGFQERSAVSKLSGCVGGRRG